MKKIIKKIMQRLINWYIDPKIQELQKNDEVIQATVAKDVLGIQAEIELLNGAEVSLQSAISQIDKNLKDLQNTVLQIDKNLKENGDTISWAAETLSEQSYRIASLKADITKQLEFVFTQSYMHSVNPVVIQVAQVMRYGDATGNCIINKQEILQKNSYKTGIFSIETDPILHAISMPSFAIPVLENKDILLYHYSGHCALAEKVIQMRCKKVLYYHNITPFKFFQKFDFEMAMWLKQGQEQLLHIIHYIDYCITDSEYNRQDLLLKGVSVPIDVVPLSFSNDKRENQELFPVEKYQDSFMNIIFVGHILPQKKIEDVLFSFLEYCQHYNSDARLFLIGSYDERGKYYQYLKDIVDDKKIRNVVFTGHVSDEELFSYYNCAHLFLCMSEHEGFCVPIVEAMSYKVPVVAYKCTAVQETLGNAGVLLEDKNPTIVAACMERVLSEPELREDILKNQALQLEYFNPQRVQKLFVEAIKRIEEL